MTVQGGEMTNLIIKNRNGLCYSPPDFTWMEAVVALAFRITILLAGRSYAQSHA